MKHPSLPRAPLLAAAAILCLSPIAQGSTDLSEHAKDPVVMIAGNLGATPTFGAGIIFSRDKDRLFIVTANHVVRSAGTAASNLAVRLRIAPTKSLPAHLLAQYDVPLDVAVLSVDNLAAQGINPCSLSLDDLPPPGTAKRGSAVFPVGNPNGVPWSMPVVPDYISDVFEGNLVFQSSLIAHGHSGGALINTDGQMLGMIQADEPPFGRAISIEKILQIFEDWKLRFDLNVHFEGSDPPLIVAVANGQLEEVKRLLAQACAKPNAIDGTFGFRAVELAVRNGNLDLLKLLADAGADLNAKGHDGSIIYSATVSGNAEIVQWLLSHGALCCGDALPFAASEGYVDITKLLLAHGADPNRLYGGRTALYAVLRGSMYAGHHPDKELMVRTLIQAGANVNLADFDGETPLLAAIDVGSAGSVRALLEAGARIDARDRGQRSVWEVITTRQDTHDQEIAAIMVDAAPVLDLDGETKLLDRAAREGWTDVVGLLIKHGIDVKGNAGGPALMSATVGGQPDVVKLLLDTGTKADANSPQKPGSRPLLEILQTVGLDERARDPEVRLRIARLLISKGASVTRGKSGVWYLDPLYVSLFDTHDLNVAALLIDRGADVNGEDDYGYSYLHHARGIHDQGLIDFLLKRGARDQSNPTYPR